jgi:hypothetical protein
MKFGTTNFANDRINCLAVLPAPGGVSLVVNLPGYCTKVLIEAVEEGDRQAEMHRLKVSHCYEIF